MDSQKHAAGSYHLRDLYLEIYAGLNVVYVEE
jgi:hypothetical protein